ncbi:MAG TPA: MFS transporter [Edaphocola sp.]|nr:MFS transporter [Edaphocola sp.]
MFPPLSGFPAKKVKRAWCLYDWANSAYNLVITTTVFPVYYLAVTTVGTGKGNDVVDFFGWKVINSALLNYAIAVAYLIIAFLSPVLSSIADYKGNKKRFMQLFTTMGALACCGLYFFYPGHVAYGIGLAVIAAVGYCGSLVFYNAFLPEIAHEHEQDKLSARGFAFGYIGSVLLQVICLVFILYDFKDKTFAPRLSFLLVGIWWLGFAQITFKYLPSSTASAAGGSRNDWLRGGFRELRKVAGQIKGLPVLKLFLPAFFFYSMGVQTVMLAAAEFGSKEIMVFKEGHWVHVGASDLIPIILLIQLVAIGGAFLMAKLADVWGNIVVLMLSVAVWIGICFCAYFIHTLNQYYLLAVAVGLVMGGIQALSRSTYTRLMPETRDTASFLSFYDVMEKCSIVLGMFTFGFLENITGSMRQSIIALAVFFLIGGFLLFLAHRRKKKALAL